MSHARLSALQHIVSPVFLIGGDEVRVVNAGKGSHHRHLLANHLLERWLQYLGTVHSVSNVHATDVPTANDQIVRMDHGNDAVQWNVDLFAGSGVCPEFDGGCHDNGAVVVCSTRSFSCVPDQAMSVSKNASSDSRAIVAAPADQHHPSLADMSIDLEVVDCLLGSRHILTTCRLVYSGGAVGVL